VCLILSAFRLYPLGGARQLLGLSPFVALAAAAGLESRHRVVAWLTLACGLTWVAGSLSLLPDYYSTVGDTLPPRIMKRLARRFGVTDFVAGDNKASIGAVVLIAEADPSFRAVMEQEPDFARFLQTRRPFFLLSLSRRFFVPYDGAIPPLDAALLKHYDATALILPTKPSAWLEWYVYLLRPKPGPSAPVVLDAHFVWRPLYRRGHGPRSAEEPATLLVEFSTPMRPEDITTDSVHLVPESAPGQFDRRGELPLRIGYGAGLRTLAVEPLVPLVIGKNHLLTLSRSLHDLQGNPLDAGGPELHRVVLYGKPK
jgi:hypothetical protein